MRKQPKACTFARKRPGGHGFETYAFCIWDGGFLPSEAEYTYAAAGGTEHRQYPWGADAPGKTNQHAIYGCNYPDGAGSGNCKDLTHIAPVDFAQRGASGRAPRDGYFEDTNQTKLLASYHDNGFYATNRFHSFGFRCARSP
jgi:formylglycine-generating enzyme required for sulfatase activity